MQKIQCLQIAKGFLSGNFKNSMEALAVGHTWRNRFEDQLHLVYKEWLLRKVTDEFAKSAKVEEFLGGASGILGDQLALLEK